MKRILLVVNRVNNYSTSLYVKKKIITETFVSNKLNERDFEIDKIGAKDRRSICNKQTKMGE